MKDSEEVRKLKGQLAERDALLRKALASCDEATDTFEDDPNGPGQWTCHACFAERKALWMHGSIIAGGPNQIEHTKDCWAEQARNLFSARAEPSAPVEIDERAEFEAAWSARIERLRIRERGNEFYRVQPNDLYRWSNVQDAWELWQARAALERKPS